VNVPPVRACVRALRSWNGHADAQSRGCPWQYTYGVFLAAFVQEFPDTSITLLAAVGSISTGVMEMTAVVGGCKPRPGAHRLRQGRAQLA